MRLECMELLIRDRREVEFEYKRKRYSIRYYADERERYISFCEFYKEPLDVKTVYELLAIKLGDKTLGEIFASLPDQAFDIY